VAPRRRRRDFFAYSFRRSWRPLGPSLRGGHVHAAWGELAGAEAMCIIVGPDRPHEGIGVADTQAILQAVRLGIEASSARPAPIITFLFCRGHALTLGEERAGLPRALAQSLRGLLVARLRGHPLVCVLGGGAYGAAYLTLAAPSHRILALRGTAVAPMAPRVLATFRRLRGLREAPDTPPDLSRMIPEIRMVESVVRLPRALAEEIAVARQAAASTRPVRSMRL
jgi:acetyl-CoA carboxylase alpha subunit